METNETQASNKKIFVAAIIVLAIMNAITGYFLFSENSAKTEVTAQKVTVEQNYANLEQEYHTVTTSLDAASIEIGQLKGKNAELDQIITDKQAMIEQTKKELDESFAQNTLTTAELNKARTMISRYESSIAELQRKVDEFAAQNQHLTAQNEQLNVDLQCEKETTTELTTKTEDLSNKLETASYLNIPNVEVAAVKKNMRGNEVTTTKAKAAENLKISFETGVNKALEPGKLSLYVRIINPKGETIAVREQGSGVITTENNKDIQYTKKADIQYSQKNKQVVMYWGRYIEAPGTYRVEVYQEGKVVGKGSVRLS